MTEKTAVQKLMEKKLQAAMSAGRVRGFKPVKVPVSVRLDPGLTVNLDVLAEVLGESRTGLAGELLRAAIEDASKGFNIPDLYSKEWFAQYDDRFRNLMGDEAEGLTTEDMEFLVSEESA